MKELYKIKSEAVQYFTKDVATQIHDKYKWKEHFNIDENALEIVNMPYISFGVKVGNRGVHSLSGWSEEEGSHLQFTINFPSIEFQEHDRFTDGKITRDLMDKLQNVIERHFLGFKTKSEQ